MIITFILFPCGKRLQTYLNRRRYLLKNIFFYSIACKTNFIQVTWEYFTNTKALRHNNVKSNEKYKKKRRKLCVSMIIYDLSFPTTNQHQTFTPVFQCWYAFLNILTNPCCACNESL